MTRVAALPELAAATYQRNALHAEDCIWVEKNCYVDIWIEVANALGLEARAMMAFTVAVDFEGDQWTFYKPPHGELFDLYGIDVQELNVWRPLLDHALDQIGPTKMIATESDSFWLPDTAGTDYRTKHVKTTIVLQSVDTEKKRAGYFHNASYHELEGEDFDHLFRVGEPHDPTFLPLFAELIRFDRKVALPDNELRARARKQLVAHLARRPRENPVARFGARFPQDLAWVQREGLPFYHAWAFATLRQIGGAFELAARHLRWLDAEKLTPAAEAFESLSAQAKTLILKIARAVNGKKPLDASPVFAEMAAAYQRGIDVLVREVGAPR